MHPFSDKNHHLGKSNVSRPLEDTFCTRPMKILTRPLSLLWQSLLKTLSGYCENLFLIEIWDFQLQCIILWSQKPSEISIFFYPKTHSKDALEIHTSTVGYNDEYFSLSLFPGSGNFLIHQFLTKFQH